MQFRSQSTFRPPIRRQAIVHRFVRTVFVGCVAPPQSVANDEDITAFHPTVVTRATGAASSKRHWPLLADTVEKLAIAVAWDA
jgi:hypothetical protein